jgi:hypothetical protein
MPEQRIERREKLQEEQVGIGVRVRVRVRVGVSFISVLSGDKDIFYSIVGSQLGLCLELE